MVVIMANETRRKMIEGTVRLLAQKGLTETSFAEVITLTGAPRGSIYHHFPDGKDQLVASAVEVAGANAQAAIAAWEGLSPREVTDRFLGLWREVLVRSDFRAGCSVLAVTIATESAELLDHTAGVFRGWRRSLAELFERGGVEAGEAARFAALLIASCEGAVVMARAERSLDPFELVVTELLAQVPGHPAGEA